MNFEGICLRFIMVGGDNSTGQTDRLSLLLPSPWVPILANERWNFRIVVMSDWSLLLSLSLEFLHKWNCLISVEEGVS